MFLTLCLSRTLEMMQNDVRTAGIDVLLGQKCFWCKMILFHEICEQHWWFGIHLRRHCKWIDDVSGWCQAEVGDFELFSSLFACACRQQQPACLKPNCMFYFWKLPHVFEMVFDVFEVFATNANETGNGYGTVGMNSHVVNSSWTVAFLLVEKDAWFASCRCLLQEGTARQEEAQHSMLHVDCMWPSFVFLCGKRDLSTCSEAVVWDRGSCAR